MVRRVLVGPHGIGRYLGDQRDVLLGGQVRYEIVELENNADVLTSLDVRPRSPKGRQLGASEEELPARRAIETTHYVQQCRLAAP